jgi:hypothetical protein
MPPPPLPASGSLPYTIAACSDHNGDYVPEHILVDDPRNPNSRWFSGRQGSSTGADPWLLLELEEDSVLSE